MTRAHAHLTSRDLAVLKTLFQCRIATYAHLASLHFGGSVEAAKKRARKLTVAGWLAVRPRAVNTPIILSLTDQSLAWLRDSGALQRFPTRAGQDMYKRRQVSDATIQHELAVMDVRCAFQAQLAAGGYEILGFSTWPLLHSFYARSRARESEVLVRPDAYLCVRPAGKPSSLNADEATFFIEIDRGTETLNTLITRCKCYREFYLSGGLARWHDEDPREFRRYPFRVLIVTTSAERRNNLAQQLMAISPPIRSQVWLTVQPDAIGDPLGPIWITPVDYHRVVTGTEFEHEPSSAHLAYRRQAARELLVAARIRGKRLL